MSTIDSYLPGNIGSWPVVTISTLRDSGTGSLRAALALAYPRIIRFAVGGTITLQSQITATSGSFFLDGRGAPGSGVQVTNAGFIVQDCSDAFITDMRFRCGNEGPEAANDYGLLVYGANTLTDNIVIANCSIAGGTGDGETFSAWGRVGTIKLLDSIVARPTVWVPTGHCTGILAGGVNSDNINLLVDRCLIAQSRQRNPLFQLRGGVMRMARSLIADYGQYAAEVEMITGLGLAEFVGNHFWKGPSYMMGYNRRPIAVTAPFVAGSIRIEGNEWTDGQAFTTQLELAGDKDSTPNSTQTVIPASVLAADSGEGWEAVDIEGTLALVGPSLRDAFDDEVTAAIIDETIYDNENDWTMPSTVEARKSRLRMQWLGGFG